MKGLFFLLVLTYIFKFWFYIPKVTFYLQSVKIYDMNRPGIANVLKLTLLLLTVGGNANAQRLEDSIHVHFNDTFTQAYKLSYVTIDTVEGTVEASYADFPGRKAYRANYYNSWRTGLYTSWYPDG